MAAAWYPCLRVQTREPGSQGVAPCCIVRLSSTGSSNVHEEPSANPYPRAGQRGDSVRREPRGGAFHQFSSRHRNEKHSRKGNRVAAKGRRQRCPQGSHLMPQTAFSFLEILLVRCGVFRVPHPALNSLPASLVSCLWETAFSSGAPGSSRPLTWVLGQQTRGSEAPAGPWWPCSHRIHNGEML